MEYLAIAMAAWYNNMIKIPKWILWIVSGAGASLAMNLLHKKPKAKPAQTRTKDSDGDVDATATATSSGSSGSIGAKKGAKLRKAKK
jgi:hypothetical protein